MLDPFEKIGFLTYKKFSKFRKIIKKKRTIKLIINIFNIQFLKTLSAYKNLVKCLLKLV